MPTDAKILSKKRLSLPGDKIAVTVEAYNEEEAVAKFHGQVKNAVSITSSKLIAKGRKSFLGSKAIPNKYEMEALQQDAVVSLTYKPKITVSADFEVKCSVCKRSNSQYLQEFLNAEIPKFILSASVLLAYAQLAKERIVSNMLLLMELLTMKCAQSIEINSK